MSPSLPVPNVASAHPIFSWELGLVSGIPVNGKRFTYSPFSSPFGIFDGPIALCGTLTEINIDNGVVNSLRVSDPTGICLIHIDNHDVGMQMSVANLEPPCFIYILGKLRISQLKQEMPVIFAESVVSISKETRNSWICATVASALSRINISDNQTLKDEFRNKIADALDTVSPNIPMPSMASASLKDEEILTMIVSLYEGKSAPKQQVLDALIAKGLTPNEAKDRISLLMENGDIYAPKFNYLKVL